MKKIAFSHPIGNPNAANALTAFSEAKLLQFVVTSFYVKKVFLEFLLPNGIKNEIRRRSWINCNDEKIYSFPIFEILRVFLNRSGLTKALNFNNDSLANLIFKNIDIKFSEVLLSTFLEVAGIYAYEDGAATSFEIAKHKNLITFYDLPTLHYKEVRRIQEEESLLYPEFKSKFSALFEPQWKIDRKEKELNLADKIIVASCATKDSLIKNNLPEEKIKVIPYGVSLGQVISREQKEKKEYLDLLYVGRLTPSKGVHYLIEVVKRIKSKFIRLHLVGADGYPDNWLNENISPLSDRIFYYGSMPHSQLSKIYKKSDLFVFPSLYEGFGLVVLEAMSHGLPVIATDTGIASELLSNDKLGSVFPIRNMDLLEQKILYYYQNKNDLLNIGLRAQEKVRDYSWEKYRNDLTFFIKSCL